MTEGSGLDGAPQNDLPGKGDQEGWRRLHPLSPLLQGGLVLVIIVGIIVANLRDEIVGIFVEDRFDGDYSSGEGDLIGFLVEEGLIFVVLLAVIGVVLLIVLFSWLSWRFYTYRITAEAVEMRKGMIFKQHRRAPLKRIQSVNLKRPLLARVFGLTQIEVQTAGQGGKVDLAYLSHGDAKQVREQILRSAARSRAQDARPAAAEARLAAEAAPGAPGEPDALAAPADPAAPAAPAVDLDGNPYAASNGRLEQRVHDFVDFDITPEAQAAGRLLKVPVGRLIGSILLGWEVVTIMLLIAVVLLASPIAALLGQWGVFIGGLGALVPFTIVMIGIVVGQFNRGFNFTLSRSSDSVRIGAGLTATNTETIPFGRIHSVEARQPLGWRLLGWWKVRVNTAGHSAAEAGQNQAKNIVLPVGRESDVLRVFETLLPGVGDEPHEVEALRDGLLGPRRDRDDGYLRAGRRAGWVLLWGRRRAGMMLADAVRPDGSPDENATLRIRRGVLTRSFSVMPIVRAQSVQLRRPLVHRMTGLASVWAHTVLGPVVMQMRGIELAAAERAFDELARTVVRVQAAESAARTDAQGERGE